mgnify:CR=1 FL=1
MILQICMAQVSDTSFTVWNTVSQQTYQNAGIDLSSVSTAVLYLNRTNGDAADEVSVDISSEFQFLFTSGGLNLDFTDFGLDTMFGYAYWPDGLWTVRIEYVYDGNEFEAATTVGFKKTISNIVYQQLMQSNWRKEISCNCGCDPYNSTIRKWEFLYNLDIAAELCLLDQFYTTLKALYRLTGVEYEYQ